MLAVPSGTARPAEADCRRRLARQLADMIPGAATIRVSPRDPAMTWPHSYARAWDAEGRQIELTRTTATVVARWVLRVHPGADWSEAHTFDLATAALTRSAQAATGRGR